MKFSHFYTNFVGNIIIVFAFNSHASLVLALYLPTKLTSYTVESIVCLHLGSDLFLAGHVLLNQVFCVCQE